MHTAEAVHAECILCTVLHSVQCIKISASIPVLDQMQNLVCFLIRVPRFLCSGMSSKLKEALVKLSTYHSIRQAMLWFSTSESSSSLICGFLFSTGGWIFMGTSSIIQRPFFGVSPPVCPHVDSLAPCIMHVCINTPPHCHAHLSLRACLICSLLSSPPTPTLQSSILVFSTSFL